MKNFVFAIFVRLGCASLNADPLSVPKGKKGAVYPTYSIPRAPTASGLDFKVAGHMPKGLILSRGGTLSGRPQETGPFIFTVDVSGGSIGKNHFKQDYSITIDPPDPVTNPLLPSAFAGPPGAAPIPANPLIVTPPNPPAITPSTTVLSPSTLPAPTVVGPLVPAQKQFWVGAASNRPDIPSGFNVSITRDGAASKLNDGGPKDSLPASFGVNRRMPLTPVDPIHYCEAIVVYFTSPSGDSKIPSDAMRIIPTPEITQPPTGTQISVSLPFLPPAPAGVRLSARVNGNPVNLKDASGNVVPAIGVTTQQATLTLATAAAPDDSVTVRYQDVTACSMVADSSPAVIGRIPVPEFRGGLAPGQTQVWVALPFAPPGTTGNKLSLRVDGSPAGLLDGTGSNVAFIAPDLSNQQAMMTLAVPLAAGQVVTSELMVNGANIPAQSAPTTVVDPLDLGKIRYYFTSGVVLSNNQGFQLQSSGTQAGLFLGLDVDRSWLSVQPHGFRRIGLNSYFDARLTSVPTQGVQAGSSTTVQDTFLQSQKAASLQAGVYLPVMTNDWTPFKTAYSFSIAPIAKAGFTTLTDQTPQSGTTVTTPSPSLTGRFFTFYSFGSRLGIHKVHKDASGEWDKTSSPESIGYFDFTTGRFGNFQAFRDLQAQYPGLPANQQFSTERLWRYSFEGIVKIPPVFVIGFNANIGHGAPAPACVVKICYPFLPPRDDLRFLFGAQFDFRQVLKKLPAF